MFWGNEGVRSAYRGQDRELWQKDRPQYTRVAPACGKMAVYRSDVTNPHAVEALTRGHRFVIQLFMVPGRPFTLPFTAPFSFLYAALREHAYVFFQQQQFFLLLNLNIQKLFPVHFPWYLVFVLMFTTNFTNYVTLFSDLISFAALPKRVQMLCRLRYPVVGITFIFSLLFPPYFGVIIFHALLTLAFALALHFAYAAARLPASDIAVRMTKLLVGVTVQLAVVYRPKGALISVF